MALTIILATVLLAQSAVLLALLLKPTAKPEPAMDPLELIAKARALGVRKLELGDLKAEIDPPVIPMEPVKMKTAQELRDEEEDLLLHSARS